MTKSSLPSPVSCLRQLCATLFPPLPPLLFLDCIKSLWEAACLYNRRRKTKAKNYWVANKLAEVISGYPIPGLWLSLTLYLAVHGLEVGTCPSLLGWPLSYLSVHYSNYVIYFRKTTTKNKDIFSRGTDSDPWSQNGLCYKALELIPDAGHSPPRFLKLAHLFSPHPQSYKPRTLVDILNP